MGMYTALSLGVEIRKDAPQIVIDVLNEMVGGREIDFVLPDHPLFKCNRWSFMLRCDSYYFDYQTHFSFEHDHISGTYFLSGVSNLKNYGGEITLFLDWLQPYIHQASAGFIGWTQYEEDDFPTLLMLKCVGDGKELIRVNPFDLLKLVMNAEDLIEELMPGVKDCAIDIGALNDFLIAASATRKELWI